jgi:hypothetical protein
VKVAVIAGLLAERNMEVKTGHLEIVMRNKKRSELGRKQDKPHRKVSLGN